MPEKKQEVLEIIERGILANKGRSEYGYIPMFS
jgi:hypothetical protein